MIALKGHYLERRRRNLRSSVFASPKGCWKLAGHNMPGYQPPMTSRPGGALEHVFKSVSIHVYPWLKIVKVNLGKLSAFTPPGLASRSAPTESRPIQGYPSLSNAIQTFPRKKFHKAYPPKNHKNIGKFSKTSLEKRLKEPAKKRTLQAFNWITLSTLNSPNSQPALAVRKDQK